MTRYQAILILVKHKTVIAVVCAVLRVMSYGFLNTFSANKFVVFCSVDVLYEYYVV
jgi:hypothetical protein